MGLVNLLVYVIIFGLVFYLLYWIVTQMKLQPPFDMVARVLVGLIAIIVLLSLLFGALPLPRLL